MYLAIAQRDIAIYLMGLRIGVHLYVYGSEQTDGAVSLVQSIYGSFVVCGAGFNVVESGQEALTYPEF